MTFDYCIIGGGIVGLATAHSLTERYPNASVIILEKESTLGRHQTGHNSGVIHSGIYYTPNSLKARLCRAGSARTKEFCHEHSIAFEERGKLIVATKPDEIPRLDALYKRAAENGTKVEMFDAAAIAEHEPNVAGLKAIFAPDAGIVNYTEILNTLAVIVTARGAEIHISSKIEAIEEAANNVTITCASQTITAHKLIACGGLQSDRLARMAGLKIKHRIVPFRGEYFRLSPSLNTVVSAMIYPVPAPGLPFLGTHLTPMIDGSVTVGPNAMLGLAREGYAKWSISPKDAFDTLSFFGFWRVMAKNIMPGINELRNSVFKSRYLKECQKYCPTLKIDDLTPMEPGIRAQAISSNGRLIDDFLFLESPRMLHVCNAPSPAATSALPIGDMIVDKITAPQK
ncbi:MAG: L-2-hydroxyglutarate oxidase [Rhodobacteraceae bacterium]|nr:L-2-hydroxyglutarate oxidase [Paracoccaceae bacterium]PHR55923.1 MAG: L-2-hydroxyglutarate oxidase [Robiginitomaculum sp.]